MRPLRTFACALALAGAVGIPTACGIRGRASQPEPLTVLVEGCDMVLAPSGEIACTFPKYSIFDLNGLPAEEWNARAEGREPDLRKMNLWVEGAWNNYEVRVDGRLLRPALIRSFDGTRVSIRAPSTARVLTVEADGQAFYSLPIIPSESPPAQSGLNDVMALWRRERARAEGELPLFVGDPSPAVRAKATALLARAELRQGNVQGAVTSFYESIDAAERAGLISDKVLSGLVLARTLIEDQRQLAEASDVLANLSPALDDFPAGKAMEPYFRALLWSEMGYLHAARRWLEASEQRAEKIDLRHHLKDVHEKLMEVFDLLGLHEQSLGHFDALMSMVPIGVCQDAQREVSLGWHALVSGDKTGEAIERSESAVDLLSPVTRAGKPGCDNALGRATALMNWAQALIEDGRWSEAERRLNEARGAKLSPRLSAWLPFLEGRIALSRGHHGVAVPWFEEAARRASSIGLPYAESAALYGRAEAIEASGAEDEALGAYARADEALQRWGALIPFGGGLQSFFGKHDIGVRRHIALLLRRRANEGAIAEAACLSRRSLARIALSVEEERRGAKSDSPRRWARAIEERLWGAPLGAPPRINNDARSLGSCSSAPGRVEALGAGEALLVVHPIADDAAPSLVNAQRRKTWAGFLITRASITAAVLGRLPERQPASDEAREGLSDLLLGPFTRELERVESEAPLGKKPVLRAALAESLSLAPLHDLPWGDRGLEETLSDRFSVLYTLDLPQEVAARERRGRTALIIVDPSMSLRKGKEESLLVEAALRDRGWDTLVLAKRDATRESVLRALKEDRVELFHYIGHGHAGDHEGFDDSLDLAYGERLTITDILDLGRAPRYVTLSACRGAASRPGSHVRGMSLAGAFLVMGAEVVVASRVDVNDAPAFEVMSTLYARDQSFFEDPARALYSALRDVPDKKLADFRVIVR